VLIDAGHARKLATKLSSRSIKTDIVLCMIYREVKIGDMREEKKVDKLIKF
jgi:hypothetical protein